MFLLPDDRNASDREAEMSIAQDLVVRPSPDQEPRLRNLQPAQSYVQPAYRNCTEVRAAGAAPVKRGEPGYGPHLDRDNDGVGCEPYYGRR